MAKEKKSVRRVERSWLKASGPDTERFLNGMWSCDVKKLMAQLPAATGAYLLNNKGRALSEGVLWALQKNEVWMAVPKGEAPKVLDALNRYLIADEVELLENTDLFSDSFLTLKPLEGSESAFLEARPSQAKDTLFKSREASFGWILPRQLAGHRFDELWIKKGQVLPENFEEISEADWTAARLEWGQPEWGLDLKEGDFPLEYPVAENISFYKGCYIGQEIIARATYRGHVNRVLSRFESSHELLPGAVFQKDEGEQPVGELRSVHGKTALGLCRISALEAELRTGPQLDWPLKVTALVDDGTFK